MADAQHAGAPTFNLGLFINALISFIIIGFAIFWAVKARAISYLTVVRRLHRWNPAIGPVNLSFDACVV